MTYRLIKASAHQTGLADRSVHCIVTSPPYFGLRAYDGDQGVEWQSMSYSPMPGHHIFDEPRARRAWERVEAKLPASLEEQEIEEIERAVWAEFVIGYVKTPAITIAGCDPGCAHEWADGPVKTNTVPRDHNGAYAWADTRGNEAHRAGAATVKLTQGAYCVHCGGWRGPLGLEPTIEAYIGHLILVAREMWRVLRDDGVMWFNLGDSYAGNNAANGEGESRNLKTEKFHGGRAHFQQRRVTGAREILPKNLMMIPARFALAAQADGWYIRSAMPWIKRNGMPESVTDRPAQTVESIFLMAKSEKYFFDSEAVKMPQAAATKDRYDYGFKDTYANGRVDAKGYRGAYGGKEGSRFDEGGRSLRSSDLFFKTFQGLLSSDEGDPLAMVINPRAYKGSHFAVFPELIPEIAIKAGTSAHGCCPTCGAPWQRVVERTGGDLDGSRPKLQALAKTGAGTNGTGKSTISLSGNGSKEWAERGTKTHTTGWVPGCTCPEIPGEPPALVPFEPGGLDGRYAPQPIPCTVFDPFSGSGTTGRVALRLGRHYVGVDLSDQYLGELAPERLSNVQMEMQL